jgi:polyhydroxyalkanoate synthesis regulator phasin
MNSDTAIDFLKKGFRVTLGATTSLVESIQDPQKREENLAQIRLNPNEFAERLAEKGAVAEVEARKFVDSVVTQYSAGSAATPSASSAATYSSPSADPALERELRELTAQLAVLRAQLASGGSSETV